MEGNSNSVEWKEITILKLLFPSTPYLLWDLKVEGNHGPFGNCIPVWVNQPILCCNLTIFLKNSGLIKKFVKLQQLKNDFHMAHVEIWFLFTSASDDFTNFLKMYGNFSITIAYTNSYRNTHFSPTYLKL